MSLTAGIDLGSVYTKAAIIEDGRLAGMGIQRTGFKLEEAAKAALYDAVRDAGITHADIEYVASTGYGRNQVSFRDLQVTDLTAQSWGTRYFCPRTHTVLDIGGQTMKSMRLDGDGRVRSFRLNDKCAAGTGAFLEKTARYLGYTIEEIGPLVEYAKEAVPISGVCAQMEPEFTLVGGIMRFPTMVRVMRSQLGENVNVPTEPLAQFTGAIGAGVLARRRLDKLESEREPAGAGR